MKHIITALLLLGVYYWSPIANAELRAQVGPNLCHYTGDVNDQDNESYGSSCNVDINTPLNDAGQRIANATFDWVKEYDIRDKTYPEFMSMKLGDYDILIPALRRGAATRVREFPHLKNYQRDPGNTCDLVTSNYDANTDTDNRTEYSSDDWNMAAVWLPAEDQDRPYMRKISYHSACRNGTT